MGGLYGIGANFNQNIESVSFRFCLRTTYNFSLEVTLINQPILVCYVALVGDNANQ